MSGLRPVVSAEVAAALAGGQAVVALESTIFSDLGLPGPANAEALDRCLAAVRGAGAVPALTAVLDGVARVGLDHREHGRVCGPARKAAERDLAVALAQRWPYGATTVSAALALADAAGISVFATGGIGGVHRGDSGDVSSDLAVLATEPIAVVSAGAKAILDIEKTLEVLETRGVPVVAYRSDLMPAFWSRSSPYKAPLRLDEPAAIANFFKTRQALGLSGGLLVANPIEARDEIGFDEMAVHIAAAQKAAEAEGVSGKAVTPYLLGKLVELTKGASLKTNIALVENNARLAVRIAREL